MEERNISITIKHQQLDLKLSNILYAQMKRNYAELHMEWGGVYKFRITMETLREMLGEDFLQVGRSYLVRVDMIHHVDQDLVLRDGSRLKYPTRQKRELVNQICQMRGCQPRDISIRNPRSFKAPQPPQPADAPKEKLRAFPDGNYLVLTANRHRTIIPIDTILYVCVNKTQVQIHTLDGQVIEARHSLTAIQQALGDGFVRVYRNYLVSALAVHSITKELNLVNGESIPYSPNRREAVCRTIADVRRRAVEGSDRAPAPLSLEDYREHYRCYETAPFAFTDIEMVFDEERRVVDWVFRYGNPALAKLERHSLEDLIGSSFGSLFANMDAKWLRFYEQAALFDKTLEVIEYSPEIDANLKVLCFPTFRGHCGCILFDLDKLDSHVGQLK